METKTDLDDISAIAAVDRDNMLALLEEFPRQCQQAVEIGRLAASHLLIKDDDLDNIVILGMGGSGISGDIIRTLLEESLKLPIVVNKNYYLPAFVNKSSLVLAVSYSGDTEETLEAAAEAARRGAQIINLSSGGKLAEFARERELPFIEIPGGLQPRSAIGYLSLPIITVLNHLGLTPDFEADVDELLRLLDNKQLEWGSISHSEDNAAKQLAKKLFGKVPLIYGSDGIGGLAALRWKCQFNENSKVPAFWNQLPELNHNEITGWEEMAEIGREFYLVTLRDDGEHPQIAKRFAATGELLAGRFAGASEFKSDGRSKMARFFSLLYLGDFVSVYLALLNGVDPTPVDRIQALKAKLAGNSYP